MKNTSMLSVGIVILFVISCVQKSSAQNYSRKPNSSNQGANGEIAIPIARNQEVAVIVDGHHTTAVFFEFPHTYCSTAFLQQLGIPLPPHDAWKGDPKRGTMKHESVGEVKATAKLGLDIEVGDVRRSGFLVEVREANLNQKPHLMLGRDFFAPGSVTLDRQQSQLLYHPGSK